MSSFFKNKVLKYSHISWFSFVLLGLIVFGVGFSGSSHIIDFINDQLTEHEYKHNQEIATSLILKFDANFEDALRNKKSRLNHAMDDYSAFGYKFFIIDQIKQEVIFDSEEAILSPQPFNQSWLAETQTLDGNTCTSLNGDTKVLGVSSDQQAVIIWLQEIKLDDSNRWLLGVAKNQNALMSAMKELHINLDATMLLIFILITVLGYFAMRSMGRIYERHLESQLKKKTIELNKAHDDVLQESKLATIGKTATVLAHEMRNPLASIKLALSVINGSENLEDREKKRVRLVLGEVDRLDNLLSETLDYAKPVKLSKKPVDLDRLLALVVQEEELIIKQKEITLKNIMCTDCTAIRIDKAQFHQVLLNLLKNAIEASPNNGLIETSLLHKGDKIVFEISNQGDLLSEEVLKNAFVPFYTTKSKGTGLGLGLVKRVVEEHGGTVTLENHNETGVSVNISLPIDLSQQE